MKLNNLVGEFIPVTTSSYISKDGKPVDTVSLVVDNEVIPNCVVGGVLKKEDFTLFKPCKLKFNLAYGSYNGKEYQTLTVMEFTK